MEDRFFTVHKFERRMRQLEKFRFTEMSSLFSIQSKKDNEPSGAVHRDIPEQIDEKEVFEGDSFCGRGGLPNEYVFLQTQPQLYRFLKNDCPELYQKIHRKVEEGKWEPDGGMWLEADCNISSGESLVRQFLHGIRFSREEFGKNVRSTHATYDIQFGHVERPTHFNTSWDYARFEVVGHKWADLSEGNYGVSLLNDCKYGYSIKDGVMKLSLLKSSKNPDTEADMGTHTFTYSILPHAAGNIPDSGTIEAATALNLPMHVVPGRTEDCPAVRMDRQGVCT